jgi:hypothetical protein
MKDDDLYPRYQTLAALMGVLLHDLRNPLHSATLLLEAMGSKTADIGALRGKLRGQFTKLEALMSEAGESIKALSLEPRIADVGVDELLRSIATVLPTLNGDAGPSVPASSSLRVSADPALLVHAVSEIIGHIRDREAQAANQNDSRSRVVVRVDEPEAGSVRLNVGDFKAPADDAAAKAPFAIAGGGIRLALARGLSQMAGAALRLESVDDRIHFALYLRRAN